MNHTLIRGGFTYLGGSLEAGYHWLSLPVPLERRGTREPWETTSVFL